MYKYISHWRVCIHMYMYIILTYYFLCFPSFLIAPFYFSGDVSLKPYITSEPDFLNVSLDGSEDFLVMASDGLWDFVTDDDVAREVYNLITAFPGVYILSFVKFHCEIVMSHSVFPRIIGCIFYIFIRITDKSLRVLFFLPFTYRIYTLSSPLVDIPRLFIFLTFIAPYARAPLCSCIGQYLRIAPFR